MQKARALLAGPYLVTEQSGKVFTIALPPGSRSSGKFNADQLVKYIETPEKFASRPAATARSFDSDGEVLIRREGHCRHERSRKEPQSVGTLVKLPDQRPVDVGTRSQNVH
jgi:hypothetical protein